MAMHWTEKQSAILYLGYDLEKRGWKLHGFHHGDPMAGMTDGYDPDSWSGCATKGDFPGIVLVVYQHRGFAGGGSEPDYPAHQATPEGKFWHLEKGGVIVAQGFGLQQSYGYNDKAKEARQRIIDDIENAAKRALNPVSPSLPVDGTTGAQNVTVTHERDWTWVKFGAKPSPEICELLNKTWGARFSRKRLAWFITRSVAADSIFKSLIVESRPPAEPTPTAITEPKKEELDETW